MSAYDPARDAVSTAAAIRAGEVSPVELLRDLLDRIYELDTVNAFTAVFEDEALEQARAAELAVARGEPTGDLHGVPVTIKEHIWIRGVESTFASPAFRGFVAPEDAVLVRRLREAGAIVVGQTNNSELGTKAITDNEVFGATANPWDPTRTCGGSSGGAAAALALGLGPLAIGTDQGGSCRIPASFCGVVGFKPSFGLVPRAPGFPDFCDTSTLWVAGPLARTARDVALCMDVIGGPTALDPATSGSERPTCFAEAERANVDGLRIGASVDLGFAFVEPDVRAGFNAATDDLGAAGWNIEEAHPTTDLDAMAIINVISLCEVFSAYREYLRDDAPALSAGARALLHAGRDVTAADYLDASRSRARYERAWLEYFEHFDVLITPTMQMTAFPLGMEYPPTIDGNPVDPQREDWVSFCVPASIVGLPAVSIPCGLDHDGLPIGLQIIGRRFEDANVLRVAAAIEELRPRALVRPEPGRPVR